MKILLFILFIIWSFLAGVGASEIIINLYKKYHLYPDERIEISFGVYVRPDGSGYIRHGESDIAACKLLISSDNP